MNLPLPVVKLRNLLRRIFRPGRLGGLVYVLLAGLAGLRKNVVLMESHKGETFAGSPWYMLRYLLAAGAFPQLRFVVVCSRENEPALREAFPSARVSYCRAESLRYGFHLATARFLVNDVSFPAWFSRRDGQYYLNTWHGTPVKALGIGVPRTLHANLRNMQRNFLHATHLLFPNAHTETVLMRDFGLRGLWQGRPVRCGYPRNDVLARRRAAPPPVDGPVHVAYMPTWRGTHDTLSTSSRRHVEEVMDFMRAFAASAPPSMVLWVKLHPLMTGVPDFSGFRNIRQFPAGVETYEHLATCSALVTDYSSVMIDFAVGGGAVLLYAPDFAEYRKTQDFSLEPADLPFPMHADAAGLVAALASLAGNVAPAPTNALLASLVEREDGQAARRVCDIFFGEALADTAHPDVAADHGNRALLLIGQPLTVETRAALDAVIAVIRGTGLSVVIATPGEGREDPLLVSLVKAGGVTFCPSASSGMPAGISRPGSAAGPESRRLFAAAKFRLLVRLDECPYYRRLVNEFPPSACLALSLRDPAAMATLPDRVRAIVATGHH